MVEHEEPVAGKRPAGSGLCRWPVLFVVLAAATASLSALFLDQMRALRADVEALKSELGRRRDERQEAWHRIQVSGAPQQTGRSEAGDPRPRRRRADPQGSDVPLIQPCLQMLADSSRQTFQKEFAAETHTGIPWMEGLRRGEALVMDHNRLLVKEAGYFFLYSQVYYVDSTFAMGHIVVRRKSIIVGNEPQHVVLFRCIQNMNAVDSFNTCYTGGVVKLEVDDLLELLIPRPMARISLDGASTFLGALKLA